MFINIFVSLSNMVALYPINESIKNEDWISFICLIFVTIFSVISHLVMNHKHGLTGIGMSKDFSIFTNHLDVVGSIILIFRLSYLYFSSLLFMNFEFNIWLGSRLLFVLLLSIISEFNKTGKYKLRYIITHSLWHIFSFLFIGQFFNKIY